MSIRKLLLSACLIAVVCAAASSQPMTRPLPEPPPVPPRLNFEPPFPVTPTPPSPLTPPSPPLPVTPTPPTPPLVVTVDELLNELERVQAKKAALEKQEQELKATLVKKLEAQAERLKKLGVAAPEKEAEPDRVARIIIEGFAEKDEKKVRDLLGMVPGQILKSPALREARANLCKAGFHGATVEVVPNAEVSHFKDIRVRSADELDR